MMGKVYSMLTRPVRTFNIENRAEKVISQTKPIRAPQYTSTEKQKRLSDQVNPNFLENHYRRDVHLDGRLKDVFVTSTDPQVDTPVTESRHLPQNRYRMDEFIFELYEPAIIPEGKCSLKQAFTFISQHREDPTTYSSETIAAEYKLDSKVVDDILKHFKLYVHLIPNYPEVTEVDPLQDLFDQGRKQNEKRKKLEEEKQKN